MAISVFRTIKRRPTFLHICFLLSLFDSATGALTWVKPTRSLTVYEKTPVGTVVGNLTLQGAGVLNIASQCSHLGVQQNVRTSNYLTVDLVLNTDLDKENPPADLTCNLAGSSDTDTPSPVPLTVQIIILDVNDETPRLLNQPYSVSVSESQTINSVVFQNITAADDDLNDRQYYTLTTKGSDDKFTIDPTNGHIILQNPLDFEDVRFYQYVVTVTDDAGHSASADVFITVLDEQDTPPFFTGEPFQKVISENEKLGTTLVTVKAADGDKGKPNAIMLTVVNESCSNVFSINKTTGVITLKNDADRDSGVILTNAGVCSIVVLATEDNTHPQLPGSNYTATTSVTISILDENDNAPLFSNSSYTITVDENTPNGSPINLNTPIRITDIDQGTNAAFDVKVVSLDKFFDVAPSHAQSSGDILIRVKDSTVLDYEKNQILVMELQTQDSSGTNIQTATVTISISNLNDNSPKFKQPKYQAQVPENSPNGVDVTTVNATDDDSNMDGRGFGTVTYSLDRADPSFGINNSTGQVSVISSNLDRETQNLYYLTVIATDGGKNKATVLLEIRVTDVNDQKPVFNTVEYVTSLKESETNLMQPITVHATDNDEPNTNNSQVTYAIVGSDPNSLESNFSLNPMTGQLSVASGLDYEKILFKSGQDGKITLFVEAQDQGYPSLTATSSIIIMLQDVNDNDPKCNLANYISSIPENQVSTIITINAKDKDGSAPNNIIMYSLDQVNAGKFFINTSTGVLSTREKLDREVQDHYSVTVTVVDFGVPSRSGTCQVTISVTDVNDEPPVFKKKTPRVPWPENQLGMSISNNADDPDQNPSLAYDIDWDNCEAFDPAGLPTNTSALKKWIYINPKTGDITNLKEFDRESVASYTIVVMVKDVNSQNGSQVDTATLTLVVEDVNDNPPTFPNNNLAASIQENMQKGSEVKTALPLVITDSDTVNNSMYNIALSDVSTFDVSPSHGTGRTEFKIIVINASALDYELHESINITVVAVDINNFSLKNEAVIVINITNENDNIPEFIGAPYRAKVSEKSSLNSIVFNCTAKDNDKGVYGILTYDLQDPTATFTISSTSGEIIQVKQLDRETTSDYTLLVTATDKGDFRATTQLVITVTDENDNAPVFTQSKYSVNINEETLIISPEFYVEATDKDAPNTVNSQIEYRILNQQGGSPQSHLKLDQKTGKLIVVSPLDREELSLKANGTFVLQVQARDKGNPALVSKTSVVEVNVMDVNDNSPKFSLDSYKADIRENVTPGTSVTTITATDEDVSSAFNQVTYQLDALSSKVFSIDKKTGVITVKGSLDREQTSEYSIMVTALDNGSPAQINTTLVTVTVTDVNDSPPVLSWDYLSKNVEENKPFSVQISATDPDETPDLIFSINWPESAGLDGNGGYLTGDLLKNFVTINSKTGEISSNGPLDREKLQRLQLTLVVTDQNNVPGSKNNDTATLSLVIEDVNDNAPRFPSENLMATIQENMPAGSEIKMNSTLTISDVDTGDNSMYTIQLDDSSVFEVSTNQGKGSTSLSIKVHNASVLDYELHKSFNITIIAKEDRTKEQFIATCTITINVENVNDNFPKFAKSTDEVYLQEDAIKGDYITTIYAHDADESPYGTVYYLIDEDGTGFAVNNISGDVILDMDQVDREKRDSYTVVMKARDVDGFEGSMQLIVKLLDVNDQAPEFKATSYKAEVKENESTFQQKLFVQATDADEPGNNNSKVFYKITKMPPGVTGSIFQIGEETGEITLSANAPDYESLLKQFQTSILYVEVTAIDRGVPPLSSSVVVNVTLLDTNDVYPLFDSLSYSAIIRENSAEGVIVTTVTAVDKDGTSPNNDLYYAILSGSRDKLQVNSSTGEIRVGVGATLDREGSEKDGFLLTVLAIDKGNPALTGTTTVTVTLADVNDSPPEFSLSQTLYSLYENASVGTEITRLNATDKDEYSELNYSISWNDCHAIDERGKSANASLVQQWLTISNSGVITVLSEMDRETAEELILRVVVTDTNGTENMPQTATATITVSILDVNDNDPLIEQLTGGWLYLNVSEGTKVNSEVTTLLATDRDKGQTVTFSSDKSESHFTVSPAGKLSLTSALDRETKPQLQFNITATDSGSPPRSSVMAVWVQVLDMNDNDPEFINNITTFFVLENSDNTTLVGSVTAQDKDLGDNGNVTYEFKDNGPFRINQLTGDFYVSEELDREARSSYTLTVLAMDNPELDFRRRAPLVITVQVEDVNDNTPQFPAAVLDKGYEGILSEKDAVGASLKILPSAILATDADAGNNSLVKYSLLDSEFDFFTINSISGEVTVKNNLKNNSGTYSYMVNATDQGTPALWTVANLTITVLDENINAPVFVQQGPVPNIPECAVAGKSVYTFYATDADKDKMTNGKVQYFLDNVGAGNNYSQLFYLNPDTGELFTSSSNKANTFDKEKLSNFHLQVQARDNGIPPNIISTGPLLITITDINDSPPVFNPIPDTNLTVQEGFLGTVGTVKATDADEGSQLNYTIYDIDDAWKDGYFAVRNDPFVGGVISTLKPLDRELVAQIRMKVVARDVAAVITDILCDNKTNTLDQTSAPLDILVNVEDINDNPPQFHVNSLTIGFLSSTNFGERIINLQDHVQDEDREAGHRIHQFHQLGDLAGDKDITSTWAQSGRLAEIQPIRVDRNGTVSTNYKFPENAFGFFTLRILANDTAGNDTVDLKIYIVGDQQVIHLTVWHSEDELRTLQHILTSELSSVGYQLVPDNILPAYTEDGRLDSSKAVLVAHAVDSRGSIVDGKSLLNKIDTYPQKQEIINRYQILKTQTAEEAKQVPAAQTEERIKDILYGIIAVIAITFIITLYVLIYNIRRFKRKLKAATLEVQGLDPIQQKIIPGVDNSNMQKSNPLFMVNNLMLDDHQFPAGQDEEHSDSVSIASYSSLDKNALNSENVPWKTPSALDEQELTLDLYDTEAPNHGLYPTLPKYPEDDFTSRHRPHTSQEDSNSLDSFHMTLSHIETTDI